MGNRYPTLEERRSARDQEIPPQARAEAPTKKRRNHRFLFTCSQRRGVDSLSFGGPMDDVNVRLNGGGTVTLKEAALNAFQTGLSGRLLTPGSSQYDEARTIWNSMIDRRPALIVRCATADDVAKTVRLASQHG